MNRAWILGILIISFTLLALLKSHEKRTLVPFYKGEKTLKLERFREAMKTCSLHERDLLELWESMLTGRSAPLAKQIRKSFSDLGLNHLFTPSGFHLSALFTPMKKILRSTRSQLIFIVSLALLLLWVPGMSALKRMSWIKGLQIPLGTHLGFLAALTLDVLFGSFQNGALSFSYSFLFLGIIYSGLRGVGLVIWFYFAQVLIAYFQGNFISPLLLILSPVLNVSFARAMPFLFLLSFPLADWQIELGLMLLQGLLKGVTLAGNVVGQVPLLEIHLGFLVLVTFIIFRQRSLVFVCLALISSSLNLDLSREPSLGPNEYQPQGRLLRITSNQEKDQLVFEDGRCERKLVRGFWWEKCSPSRTRSTRRLKKFSYPS